MPARGPYAKGAERREEILETALAVIADKGFHGTTLRGVARELGLEPAHVLYYFGSREGLMRAVVERWDQDNAQRTDGGGSVMALAESVRHNQTVPGVVQLFLGLAVEASAAQHEARSYFHQRYRGASEGLAQELRKGQIDGFIRSDLDASRTARQLVALSDGLQLQWLIDNSVDVVGDIEAAIRTLLVTPPHAAASPEA